MYYTTSTSTTCHNSFSFSNYSCRRLGLKMQGKFVIIVAFFAFSASASLYCRNHHIDEGIASTICISAKVCANSCTEQTAKDFYSCYDAVPESQKAIFVKCQNEGFNLQLDSKASIQALCFQGVIFKIGKYADCLKREFNDEAAQAQAVRTVNQCQAKKVGLNN